MAGQSLFLDFSRFQKLGMKNEAKTALNAFVKTFTSLEEKKIWAKEFWETEDYGHKIKSRAVGFMRFTNRSLYEKYGLYKVPTTAGWTKAHASR
jgi:hypothetical protein